MARKPGFLVAGTAKAGTTSMAQYLSQHPGIEIPRKESFFFNSDEFVSNSLPYPMQRLRQDIVRTREDYEALYWQSEASLLGEVGTGYLYHYKEAIPKIKAVLGSDVPVLIVLRNPVERAYSAYMHFKKDCFEKVSFTEALEIERHRIEQHWDFMWHYKAMGFYYEQVRAYLENFDRVQVCFFEDLKRDPKAFMKPIFHSLELDPFNGPMGPGKNPSGEARFPWLQRLITHENPIKQMLRPIVRTVFSSERRSALRKGLKARNLKPSEGMLPETRAELASLYKRDVLRLSDLLKKDLTHWTYVA